MAVQKRNDEMIDLLTPDFVRNVENTIANTQLVDMAAATIKGRASGAGTGDPTDLTAAQVTTILAAESTFTEAVEDIVGAALTDSSTIDFTYTDASGAITAAIIADSVANTHLANMAAATIKGRASGAGTGDPTDLTASQVTTIVATVADYVDNTNLANMAAATVKGRASGAGTGDPTDLTAAQVITILTGADGTGSLLDADLLDGQHAAAFSLTSHTHTAIANTDLATMAQATVKGRPVASGTGTPSDLTAAQLVAIVATADGAGSGLDADLLDGISSAAFPQLASANTFTTVQTIDPATTGVNGLAVDMPASTTGYAIYCAYNGTERMRVDIDGTNSFLQMSSYNAGSGAGPMLSVGRNSNGSTAAPGTLAVITASNSSAGLWPDNSGVWRTAQDTGITSSNFASAGTVVGTQTSWHELKEQIVERIATDDLLQAILGVKLYNFQLKNDTVGNTYTGIVISEQDKDNEAWYGCNYSGVPALNERNLFGYLIGAVQALTQRVEELEAKLSGNLPNTNSA